MNIHLPGSDNMATHVETYPSAEENFAGNLFALITMMVILETCYHAMITELLGLRVKERCVSTGHRIPLATKDVIATLSLPKQQL